MKALWQLANRYNLLLVILLIMLNYFPAELFRRGILLRYLFVPY